jgi:nicotinamidase-related amidase
MRFLTCLGLLGPVAAASAADPYTITARQVVAKTEERIVLRDGQQVKEAVEVLVPIAIQKAIDPAKCAIVICDMWDDHWCKSAATRCDALAKKAGPVVDAARKAGMTIIHCPSDCMGFYKDHPARKRTLAVKPTEPPKEKQLPNPPLPIDDSDGGCDDASPAKQHRAWTRQHAAITIDGEKDFITDNGKEAYSVLAEKGVKTVFVMGVHTNMCVLHRTFAIKQLRRWDVDCLLVRDLTDAMYNPAKKPFVTHDEGTGLVVRYIERYWCPSVESSALTVK